MKFRSIKVINDSLRIWSWIFWQIKFLFGLHKPFDLMMMVMMRGHSNNQEAVTKITQLEQLKQWRSLPILMKSCFNYKFKHDFLVIYIKDIDFSFYFWPEMFSSWRRKSKLFTSKFGFCRIDIEFSGFSNVLIMTFNQVKKVCPLNQNSTACSHFNGW